jgi:hypothetical protein
VWGGKLGDAFKAGSKFFNVAFGETSVLSWLFTPCSVEMIRCTGRKCYLHLQSDRTSQRITPPSSRWQEVRIILLPPSSEWQDVTENHTSSIFRVTGGQANCISSIFRVTGCHRESYVPPPSSRWQGVRIILLPPSSEWQDVTENHTSSNFRVTGGQANCISSVFRVTGCHRESYLLHLQGDRRSG